MLPQIFLTALTALAIASPPIGQGLGTSFCYGANCPCANDDATAGCRNSSGQGGVLTASGSTSIAADDIVYTASHLPNHSVSLLVVSRNQRNIPFHEGRMCVGPNIVRFHPHTNSNSGGTARYDHFVSTLALYGTTISAGDTWYAQSWYRDSAQQGLCNQAHATNLTSGLAVTFTP
jgi:hypothetical protein